MMIWVDSAAGDEESTDRRATEIWSIGTLPLAGQRRESMGRPGFRLGSLQILEAGCERRRRGKPRDWWTCCPTSFGSVNSTVTVLNFFSLVFDVIINRFSGFVCRMAQRRQIRCVF